MADTLSESVILAIYSFVWIFHTRRDMVFGVIDNKIFKELILDLDTELGKAGESYEIVVVGASALIALNKINRQTVDIDLIDPEIDSPLFKAAMAVGEKHGLSYGWLNSSATAFASELPNGWEERTKLHIKAQNLKVKVLGRSDMIFSKLHAAAQRDKNDLDDLLSLKPSKAEINGAKKHLLSNNDSQLFKDRVEELEREILSPKNKKISRER